jgi:hypothetical protein
VIVPSELPAPGTPVTRVAATRIAPGRVIVALALTATAALVPLLGDSRPIDTRIQIALDSILVVILSLAGTQLVLGLRHNAEGIARWRAGPWYLIWSALAYGVASLTRLTPPTGTAALIQLSSIATALLVIAMATIAWTGGYLAGPPAPVRTAASSALGWLLRGTRPAPRSRVTPWALYTVGTLARFATAAFQGMFGYVGDPQLLLTQPKAYTQLLSLAATFTVFGIATAAYQAFTTGRTGSKVTLWILVVLEVVAGAAAGGKQSFVVSVLAVVIPYGAVRGKLSLRILVIGTLVFLWLVMPFNAAYRAVVRAGDDHLTPAAALAVVPEIFSGTMHPESPGTVLPDSSENFLARVRLIDSVAVITQLTPSTIPYRSTSEFAYASVVGLVPRAVWPDKPVLASGYKFSQEYFGLPSTMYTSSAVTPVGDLYRHGGLPMVAAGALVLGAGCRLFDTLIQPEKDPRAIFFMLVFLPEIVKSELDVVTLIAGLPLEILTAVLGVHFACRPSARTTGKAA